jgi:hypothetical protein
MQKYHVSSFFGGAKKGEKRYAEIKIMATFNREIGIGVAPPSQKFYTYPITETFEDGVLYFAGVGDVYAFGKIEKKDLRGSGCGDIIGVSLDLKSQNVTFYKNGEFLFKYSLTKDHYQFVVTLHTAGDSVELLLSLPKETGEELPNSSEPKKKPLPTPPISKI